MDNTISQAVMLPAIMTFGLVYFAFRALVMKDLTFLHSGKPDKKLKDEEQFRLHAGWLLLMLAGFSAIMILLLFLAPKAAMAEMIVGALIFGFLWRRMDKKYGEH